MKDEDDTYLTAWTTTPWTLPSNLALCAHPESTYVLAEVEDEIQGVRKKYKYYVAEALAEEVLGADYKILKKIKGSELEGKK